MGMIFRKRYTMPVPAGAEITEQGGVRIARWQLRNGQRRSGEVVDCQDGKLRVRGQSRQFLARYRDGNGEIVEVATGCKDEIAARTVLTKLERNAELVRAGVLTTAETDIADHATSPLSKHVAAYERHLRAKGSDPRRMGMVLRRLERLARACRFTRLQQLSPGPVERWIVAQADAGMGAATRNGYRESLIGFGNWCRRTHRLTRNPFADLPRADQNADRRHQRRALTVAELLRLLKVARLRPLAEYGRGITPTDADADRAPRSRATWKRVPLTVENLDAAAERAREALKNNPGLLARLERTGRERALIYKTLFLTGLRKGELASLAVGQLELHSHVAFAVLNPSDEKNRRGSDIPLRADLVAELRAWLTERLEMLQDEASTKRKPIPARLPLSTPLFRIPSGLTRIFDRDLATAGIPKRDERNRVVDIHALRVTFGTHLCAAGIPLRTAQAAMRHSKPELTANIYTDPKLLDVAGAIAALPPLTPSETSLSAITVAHDAPQRRRVTS
ncbi:MAG: site-specific integrase [Phycisphaerales bacterium]|nr:site-specific integrase [Phycisphaerales bacterium]